MKIEGFASERILDILFFEVSKLDVCMGNEEIREIECKNDEECCRDQIWFEQSKEIDSATEHCNDFGAFGKS